VCANGGSGLLVNVIYRTNVSNNLITYEYIVICDARRAYIYDIEMFVTI